MANATANEVKIIKGKPGDGEKFIQEQHKWKIVLQNLYIDDRFFVNGSEEAICVHQAGLRAGMTITRKRQDDGRYLMIRVK